MVGEFIYIAILYILTINISNTYNNPHMIHTEYIKVTLSIPKRIIDDLKDSTNNMSKYVSEAIEEKRLKERREQAWQELLAAPPTHTEIDDPVQYIIDLRKGDDERMKRLGL